MRRLSILSLTAVASVMMAGAPAISSQASVYTYRVNTGSGMMGGVGGRSGFQGDCAPVTSNNQDCPPDQSGNRSNLGERQNSGSTGNTAEGTIFGDQQSNGGGRDLVVKDLFGGNEPVIIPGGKIVTETLPGATVIQPSISGGAGAPDCDSKPTLPDCDEDQGKPETPELPENPGKPGNPGQPENPGNPETPEQPEQPEDEENSDADDFALAVLGLVNEERAKAGLNALTLDASSQEAANVRAVEIQKSFSHTRPNGSGFSTALTEAGVRYTASGENIAYGQNSPQEVMSGWMNSSGHRANILNASFTSIGIGHMENASGVDYWTQLFFR